MSKTYEEKTENQQEIPVPSRRSEEEKKLLEYLQLREDVEKWYKKIRAAKKRIETLSEESQAVRSLDSQVKKRPRELEEDRISKKKKKEVKITGDLQKQEEARQKTKLRNARKKKIENHRSYIRQGYTMSEKEIAEEGGEVWCTQYLYYKETEDGKVSQHLMAGLRGLKLSSNIGEEDQEMLQSS